MWGEIALKRGGGGGSSGNTGHHHSFPTHRAFWPRWNIPVSRSAPPCHTRWSSLAQGQFVFTVLTIARAFPFHPHRPDLPFLPPSPQSNNYHQMQEEPCCGSAAHNSICYANTSCAPCQHGTSPRHKTGVWEMVTQAWYFLLQLLCPSPSSALLWARAINIKWHEWNKDGGCLFIPVWVFAAAWTAVLQISRDC